MAELDTIIRNKRYPGKSTAKAEKNSGEVIVRENLTMKLRELMENWTTNPGILDIKRSTGGAEKSEDIDLDSDIPQIGDDITDMEARINKLETKKSTINKLKAEEKKAKEKAKIESEAIEKYNKQKEQEE